MSHLYFDYAATTPLDPLVLEAMLPYLSEHFANPSSLHQLGQKARRGLETAREQVAAALGAKTKEISFTSGATEAINQVLRGLASQQPGKHIITSQLEHSAVLETCRYLEAQGHPVSYLEPSATGEISPQAIRTALTKETSLLALMHTNNETGIQTDIAAASQLAHQVGALVFCDAVQAFGFEAIKVNDLGVDMLCLSAHKFYGPKGVGILYLREGLELPPLMLGGKQERGLRAGTHNLASLVGMGKAAELAMERLAVDSIRLQQLRERLEAQLQRLAGVRINGANAPRGPKHCNVQVAGVDGETLLLNLDILGLCVSAGSACAAGSLEPSHVLTAMGLSRQEAKASIRFSLGRGLAEADIDDAVGRFAQALERCRA
jgi:cysteine desulfurase